MPQQSLAQMLWKLQRIKEDRMSTQKSLQLCAQLSQLIGQIQLASKDSNSPSGRTSPASVAERLTVEGMQECKNSLATNIQKLESHMKGLIDQLVAKSRVVDSLGRRSYRAYKAPGRVGYRPPAHWHHRMKVKSPWR